jgi:multicomponent Na+:H+ antiporter subunit A
VLDGDRLGAGPRLRSVRLRHRPAVGRVTRLIQNGRLDFYITATFVFLAIAILVPMGWPANGRHAGLPADCSSTSWAVIAIAPGPCRGHLCEQPADGDRLAGHPGLCRRVLFMLIGAPDLSFTQFMVETLSVVILALAMTRLGCRRRITARPPVDKLDGTIALATGRGQGSRSIMLRVTQQAVRHGADSEFFNAYSVQIAHGRNIVNVILVDFRGIDTFGEIAVVMVTGLAFC